MLGSGSIIHQCHAALEVSRLSVSPQIYFQRFIYQLKKGTWQRRMRRTLLRKRIYTSLKSTINLIAKLCCKRVNLTYDCLILV